MSINFDVKVVLNTPVNTELRIVENNYKQVKNDNKAVKREKRLFDSKDIKLIANDSKKRVKKRKNKRKIATNDIIREKMLRDAQVRKYTKEMQNRDAIAKRSRKMCEQARQTKSAADDKFAYSAAAPTKQFDKLIYNSVTADDAVVSLDDIFEDIVDSIE